MTKAYVQSVAWLLLVTAVLKLAGVLTANSAFLRAADPLLPFMNNGMVMLAAAALEFVCFVLIWKTYAGNIKRQLMVILWCASLFAVYRLGLLAINYTGPCKCLGNLGILLNISDGLANSASLITLAYFLIPSIIMLYFSRGSINPKNKTTPASSARAGLLILAAFFAGLPAPSAAASDATAKETGTLLVEGVVSNNFIKYSTNTPLHLRNVRFSLMISGNKWTAKLQEGSLLDQTYLLYTDGTNTYYLRNMEDRVKKAIAENKKTSSNMAVAIIRDDIVPCFPFMEEMGIIWLTYASGYFIKTSGLSGYMTQPCIVGIYGGSGGQVMYPRKYACSGLINGYVPFPTNLVYFYEVTNCSNKDLLISLRQFEGQTNALFFVNKFSSVFNQQWIPEASTLISRDTARDYAFWLVATNIIVKPPSEMDLPRLPGLTLFTDFRFAKGPSSLVLVYATNKWLSIEEAKQLPQYKKHFRMLEKRGMSQIIFSSLLVLLLLVSPFLLARMGKQFQKIKQQNTSHTQ